MIKYFCDICNKELKQIKGYISYRKDFNHIIEVFYLCDDCQNKFENFLQKKLNQESEAK